MNAAGWLYTSNCEVPENQLLPDGVHRYAAGVEYDGSRYCGWQYQDHSASVQEAVEQSLSKVADHPVRVLCAGRTDTGVHATGQVIHFDVSAQRSERQWLLGANANLPADIALNWVRSVPAQFHARFSAQARRYLYLIANQPTRPALLARKASWCRDQLDIAKMRESLSLFVGEHDFNAFRASQCQAKSPIRKVYHARLLARDQLLALDIRANGFLHHMVRNIVGSLLAVGRGELNAADIEAILAGGDRRHAPPTAAPDGLYLIEISYAPEFNLPTNSNWPLQMVTGANP